MLTLKGETDDFRVTLRVPNLVMHKLYVERIQRMLLPEPDDRDHGRWAAEQVYKGDVAVKKSLGWTKKSAFINRQHDLSFLKQWISEEPDNLLFIFGPKSSGKTTLLSHFIEQNMPDNRYDIKHFNLREIFIVNYQHFIQTFFSIDYSKSKEDVKERWQYNLKVFNLTVDTLKGLEEKSLDPFAVMKQELQKTAEKGIRSVIIIDELQALEGIYLNGQRELLKELFNFFVAMTKESHLCHVMIASSDGYFIERIYNDSKLKKTSRFLEVEYLAKDDVMFWLGDLPGQSKINNLNLADVQKEAIWETFGGSCWEINEFLSDLLRVAQGGMVRQEDFDGLIAGKKVATRSMFVDYVGLFKDKRKLFFAIHAAAEQGNFEETDLESLVSKGVYDATSLRQELAELVRQNFLAYNPVTAIYSLQGKSMEHGLRMFVEKMQNRLA